MERSIRPVLDKVCSKCRKIFVDSAFEPAVDGQVPEGKIWDGLAELHESIDSVYSEAVGGCIVCAAVICAARAALTLHLEALERHGIPRLISANYSTLEALAFQRRFIGDLDGNMVDLMEEALYPSRACDWRSIDAHDRNDTVRLHWTIQVSQYKPFRVSPGASYVRYRYYGIDNTQQPASSSRVDRAG